jgi:hypothetical protein
MSDAKKGNSHRKGRKASKGAKAKMSASQQGVGNNHYNKGKPVYLYVVHAHD